MRVLFKTAGRALSAAALAGAILTLIRPRRAWFRLLFWLPKLYAAAYSPFLALAGLAGVILGRLARDWAAFYGGTIGASLMLAQIGRMVSRSPQPSVAFRLGPVPPAVRRGMLPSRWPVRWPAPPPTPVERDLVIFERPGSAEPVLADLWRPRPDVPPSGLALLYLHGGGWVLAGKDFGTRRLFGHLAGQGHHVLDLAYGLGPANDIPGMVYDVKRAVVWLKTHSHALGLNPDNVVLMGASAGGHLALLSAYSAGHPLLDPPDLEASPAVRAVVSYYGPPDLDKLQRRWEHNLDLGASAAVLRRLRPYLERRAGFNYVEPINILPSLLGGRPDQVPDQYRLLSPMHHACFDCPPTLLVQGSHDFGGFTPDVRRLHARQVSCGCTSVYLELPGVEHGFDLFRPAWSVPAQVATFELERFLAAML